MSATVPVARELPMLTTSPESKTLHHAQTALASTPQFMVPIVCAWC